jgi:hypothetical protein
VNNALSPANKGIRENDPWSRSIGLIEMGAGINVKVPLASVMEGDAPFSEQVTPGIPAFLESCRVSWISDQPECVQAKQ